MLKNLKKAAAIVLSFATAVQFGLADSYYVNAVEEPVEPQQQEETTTTPQEQEEVPTTEEEAPQQQGEEDAQPAADEEPQPAADEEPQPAAEEAPQDDSTNGENQANNEAQPTPVMAAMLADNPAATYSVELKDQNGNSLGSKTITVGNVADQFPGGKETIGDKTYSYIEARVVNTANEKEYTPITYVAVYDGVTYYSTNSVTGSPLDTTSEKLVVVLKEDVTQYSVKYTLTVDGTDKSSEIANYIALEGSESTVDTGTSFSFLVKPNKGFTVKSVKQDGKVLTADGTKYTTRNVVADSTISIELTEKKEAKITFTGSNTKFTYNGKTQNTGNNYSHNLTLSSTYKTSVTELNFKLLGYLEWTSNSKELNKLAISLTYDGTSSLTGKSINIPTKPGETVETTLTDSLTAVVKKSSTKQSIGSGQYSYEYNVTLRSTKNIYDDIKITTNFKDSTSAELFVTSIVGVTSIYVNNKELDPSNSDASFINLNSNETYTFKFNVLPGYVPDASKIKVTGTVDGDDIGTVSIKNNTGSDKAKYPYYFTIKAAYGKTDYRIQVTAIQSEYKFVYKADGISSSNKLKGGEETAITAQRPKKENYVFKGWKIDSDESGKVYTSKEVVKVNDLIQYSKWDANENLSKITFIPVWIEADKAQQVTYRVVVHFDDGTEDKVYEATTAPGKDVKVFRSKLDTALGIDTDEYYVDPNQSFDLQNVKDGDTITINYCKRKEIVVNTLNDVHYNGESQKQEPVVTIKDDNSKVLQKDVDYTLSYSEDTKNVGTVTVTVTGKGLYKGTQQVTYQIIPKSVTVTADNKSKVYGAEDPELTATVAGTLGDDTVDYKLSREAGENVGKYEITVKGDKLQGNYSVTYNKGEFEIKKSGSLTIDADLDGEHREKEYDGTPLTGGAHASITEGTTISYSVDGGERTTEVPSITNVGSVTVKAKAENDNYKTKTVEYTLTVTHKPVTVTANNKSKVYGAEDPELTATVAGTLGDDTVDYKLSREAGENVGKYEITVKGDKLQGNYSVTYNKGEFEIKKSGSLTIDADLDGEHREKEYDGTPLTGGAHASITEGTTISYSVDGGEWTTEVPSITNVGSVTVKAKAENDNYKTKTVEYTLTVTHKPVTVTANNKSKVYGAEDPELTATVAGTLGDDTVDYKLSREAGENVGKYEITVKGDKLQGNYSVTYNKGEFEIKKSGSLTIDADLDGEHREKEYDGTPLTGGAHASITEGTTISYSVDGGEWTTEVPSITNVGSVTVKAKAENDNYKTKTVEYTLTVTHKPVTVTANNKSKVYGAEDPELTATVAGTLGDDTVDYKLSREAGENVGKYEITVKGDKLQGNYSVTYNKGEFEIKKSGSLTIDADLDGEHREKEYDGTPLTGGAHASITEGTTISYSVDGGEWTTEVPSITNVGSVTVKAKAENDNYKTKTVEYTLTVTHKPVTVTANNKSKVYGAEDPELTATVAGTLGDDTVDYKLSREAGENVGKYEITVKGDKLQGNYSVTYNKGEFEIKKSGSLTIDADLDGEHREKEYDGTPLTGGAHASITEGTTISYSVDGGEWTTEVPSITNVGSVTVKAKAENDNYKTKTVEYTLTVTHKPVTVTANNKSKVYGAEDPELTATVAGTLGDDTVDYKLSREAGENVGKYEITVKGDKLQGNYSVTYNKGEFEIKKSGSLTIDADLDGEHREKEYDGTPLTGGAHASITEGTTISYSVDGGEWTTEVPSITNVGSVTVKAKAENDNYKTKTVEYTLTVTHKPVTVTANNKSKVYGAEDPELTATVAGTLGDDTVDYKLSREAGENVGKYEITVKGDKLQGNYSVTYNKGEFEIKKSGSLTIDADLDGEHREKEYDGTPLTGGAHASITEGTTISYSVDGGEWTTEVPSITNVGSVTVKAKAENDNYKTKTVEYTLTVTHKPVTVTANNKSKVYGAEDPELTATVAGTLGDDTVDYKLSREAGENVGKYEITVKGDKLQGNYSVTYATGTLTITSQSIDPGTDPEKPNPDYTGAKVNSPSDEVYDGNEHKWIPTVTDKADKKLKAGTDYTVEYSTKNFKDVGTIDVTITGKGNYTGTVTRTYKITPKSVTVTAEDKTKVFGETDPKLTAKVAGTLGNDTVEYTLSRETGEAAGNYEITVKGDKLQGNYKVTYVAGKLTITSQSIDPGTDPEKPNPDYTGAKVNSPSDAVYDGNEHKWSPTVTDKSKTLELGKDYTVEYSTSDFTNVGTIEVVITGIGNYSGTVKRSYKVTPKEYTVTTESATKTYSGTALTAGGKVEGIVSGETVEFTTTGSQTEVGTSKNTYELVWKSAKATNYTLAKESIGKLTVKAKSIVPDGPNTPNEKKTGITVSEPSDSKYDGKEHKEVLTVTDTKTGKELVAGTDYSVTYSSDLVNAGTVTIKVAGLGNYTGSFTKTYKITKRPVTLTSATVSKVYDGSALTNTSITVSGDGFVEGEGASYEVTGTQTEVGNSANSFEYKLNENTLASNYDITKVVGTLTITAAPAPITPATPSTPSSTTSTTPRTPSAPQVTTPAETVEKETTPKAEPKKEEKVEEEYTPKASPQYYWALINLICAILTVLFGLLLLISKRHKDEDDDEDDDETKQQTNNDDEEKEQEKKRGLFTRVLAVLIAIVSVVFFLVTEDLSLPWTWTDQWTIWMVVIGLVQIVVFFVGRKWKNVDDDEDEEEAQQA